MELFEKSSTGHFWGFYIDLTAYMTLYLENGILFLFICIHLHVIYTVIFFIYLHKIT